MQFLTTTSEGYISLFLHAGTDAGPAVLHDLPSAEEAGEEGRRHAQQLWRSAIRSPPSAVLIGRVVAIKDDTFVLETGADRVKIRFTKTAIGSVEKLNMDKAESKTDKK